MISFLIYLSLQENWADSVLESALENHSSTTVVLDTTITHEMSWPNADDFWEIMTRSGPWYSRRVQLGDAYMEEAKERFMAAGKYSESGGESKMPLKHRPSARLIILRREITSSL